MIKKKIIAFATFATLASACIGGGFLTLNRNIHAENIQNHILLSAPDLNNLAVVINTNVSPLVLYNSPSFNSNVESYISVGEMLNYQRTSNPNFYKVTVQETGASGYISANNLQIIESGLNQAYNSVNKAGIIINVSNDVKLMSNPDAHSQVLGSYKDTTNMNVLGKQGQWYKVEVGTQLGYMYQSYVGILDSSIDNSTNNTSNINKEFTISEKMITQDGNVVIPEKIIYKGNNYNPQDIKTMVLPKGYEFTRLNVYNNGNMVETGGTNTTNLAGFNLNLPSANHLASGNIVIEYIVKKLQTTNTSANTIKVINYNTNQMLYANDLIVKNETGNPIPNNELVSVIKKWILTDQYQYRWFFDCNGTMWSKQWLNNIPESQLINYFIQANGESALSKNITASELNKTAKASLAFAKAHPNPFTQAQTKIYIKEMLKQYDPNQVITNIVFQGNQSQGGDYSVYTKQFGNKRPYWYVESWIGYPTGI